MLKSKLPILGKIMEIRYPYVLVNNGKYREVYNLKYYYIRGDEGGEVS